MAKKSLVVGNKPSSDVGLAPELDEDIVAGTPMARVGAVVEVGTVLAAAETVAAGAESESDFSSPPPQAEISNPRTNSKLTEARNFFQGFFFK